MKKRKVIHYGKKFTVLVCVALTLTITGCSEKSEESGVMVDKIENVQSENQNEGGQEDKKNSEKNEDTEIKKENNNERNSENEEKNKLEKSDNKSQETKILEGDIRSIGESGIVISQIFTEDSEEDEDVMIAYIPAEGSSDEVLITVNFTDSTKYEIKTVVNGGVNGDADVTVTEASFSDLKESSSVVLTGHYISEKEFQAELVSIYDFV